MSLYDGLDYMEKKQNIIWLGPTGCGKTGLATSFLLHAIDQGFEGTSLRSPTWSRSSTIPWRTGRKAR